MAERPGRSERRPPSGITIVTLEDAAYWINVLNRYACHDIELIVALQAEVADLRRPWWKRLRG